MDSIKGLGRDYWLFWLASSLGIGASNILQYVLSLYVLDLTGSATLFASMLSKSVVEWLYDATQGSVESYGLELLGE